MKLIRPMENGALIRPCRAAWRGAEMQKILEWACANLKRYHCLPDE